MAILTLFSFTIHISKDRRHHIPLSFKGHFLKAVCHSASVIRPHRLGLVLMSRLPVQAICGMYSVPGHAYAISVKRISKLRVQFFILDSAVGMKPSRCCETRLRIENEPLPFCPFKDVGIIPLVQYHRMASIKCIFSYCLN